MEIAEIVKASGGQFTYGLIDNIPGIAALRDKLYAKVLAIPWVDAGALRAVFAGTPDGALWSPNYAISAPKWRDGTYTAADIFANMPAFTKSLDHAVKWNELTDWWKTVIAPILLAFGKSQGVLLQNAVDNAAFWDGLYQADKFIADIPSKIAGAASSVVTGAFSKLAPVLLLGGVLFFAFIYSRSQLRKAD